MLRREFLQTSAGPCASMALSSLMARDARATNPLAARMAHHAPRAKSMIFILGIRGTYSSPPCIISNDSKTNSTAWSKVIQKRVILKSVIGNGLP